MGKPVVQAVDAFNNQNILRPELQIIPFVFTKACLKLKRGHFHPFSRQRIRHILIEFFPHQWLPDIRNYSCPLRPAASYLGLRNNRPPRWDEDIRPWVFSWMARRWEKVVFPEEEGPAITDEFHISAPDDISPQFPQSCAPAALPGPGSFPPDRPRRSCH